MTQTVLVTGASGFVGRAFCMELARRGYGVRAVVRELSSATGLPGDAVQISDIGTGMDWSSVLAGIDAVVHLASRVHVMRESVLQPVAEFRRINVEGTLNLARQAIDAGVRRFVFVSSIKVNGEGTPLNQPYMADDVPRPVDPYGISKYEAEQGVRHLAQETGLEVIIIRPVLVYGPGVKGNFLSMMRWLHKGIPLPFGAIKNQRSLVALDNLVDLIVTCLQHPRAANEIFLASDGQDLSTTELLRLASAALGRSARLIPVPPPLLRAAARLMGRVDIAERLCGSLQVDISKTRNLLGWAPPESVDKALKLTAQHFLANL